MKFEFLFKYRSRSFAIKAHVRQVVEMASRTDMAADGDGGQLVVRTVVCASDEVDGAPMDQWEMTVTADGTSYFKAMITDCVNPRPAWGPLLGLSHNIDQKSSKVKADIGQWWNSEPSLLTTDILLAQLINS